MFIIIFIIIIIRLLN